MGKLENIKNILITNLGGIGDMILSTPALRAIRAAYNKANITLLAVPRAAEVAKNLRYIDEVAVFRKELRHFVSDFGTVAYLRKRHFDLAVNMRTLVSPAGARKIKYLFEIVAPGIKAGRDTAGMGDYFDIKVPEPLVGLKAEMEYDIDTALAIGAEARDRSVDLVIDTRAAGDVRDLLSGSGVGEEDIVIGVNPGGMPSRRWPGKNFKETIAALSEMGKFKFVITGSEEESALASDIGSGSGAINLAGRTGVIGTAAVIKRCSLFISNDTGAMHMAAALRVPLVAIFGPGELTRFDPRYISGNATVLHRPYHCAPCSRTECRDMGCLKAITSREAVEAACMMLKINRT